MGGASSQSMLCYGVSAQHDVILTLAHEYLATSMHETARNVLQDFFTAAKAFLDMVTCKI